jgi:ABC-type transporter Mla subunit MlaD
MEMIKWIAPMFIACLGCQSSHTLRVSFESADKVKRGDIVFLGNQRVGSVKNVKPDAAHRAATIAILIDNSIQIPMSSEFLLAYDAFGTPYISINPSGEKGIIDWNEVQHGKIRDSPPDTISPERRMPSSDGMRPSRKQ